MTDLPIEARDLAVRYGRKQVFGNVALSVPQGSVYLLLGRNGEGKTSLVKCLLGHLPAASGQARLLGHDAWSQRRRAMEDVAYVPESPEFGGNVRVGEILRFLEGVRLGFDRTGVDERLSALGISERSRCGSLSRGQKTQVALTTALACRPRLLICDDPTLGLDAPARKQLLDRLIVELAEHETTFFLTTHDLATLGGLADQIGILHRGALGVDESADTLRGRFRRLTFADEEAASAASQRVASMEPLSEPSGAWSKGTIVARFEPDRLPPGVKASPLSLEEIFVALVDREGEAARA